MPKRRRRITHQTAELIVDILNVEQALQVHGDREGLVLAAALAIYRQRLERLGESVRARPDPSLTWLKHIKIQQGNGWLKLIDTRVKSKRKSPSRRR